MPKNEKRNSMIGRFYRRPMKIERCVLYETLQLVAKAEFSFSSCDVMIKKSEINFSGFIIIIIIIIIKNEERKYEKKINEALI